MITVVVNSNKAKFDISNLKLDKLANLVLQKECKYKNVCASINFISTDDIHKLNKDYRGIDSPTDVLSFECDGIADNFIEEDTFDIGDIFICEDIAAQNAQKYNTSIESELKLLTVHGMLHLCGFDHETDTDAKLMESKEENILDGWNSK